MSQHQPNEFGGNGSIHQHYMDIINCMPNIVYWVDIDCNLQGCNTGFVSLLGLKQIKEFSGTPYEIMTKHLPWTQERIEKIRLDDINVIFSGEPIYEFEEASVCNKEGESIYYLSTRVPLFDEDKKVIGLVVIFVDITAQKSLQKQLNLVVEPLECNSTVDPERMKTPIQILLVEDSRLAQLHEKSLFLELNCDVDVAETGEMATALFSPGKYALVLMDISLKETTGYLVSRDFRKLEKNTEHKVPIIALTEYLGDKVLADCSYYGMDGVITKPLTKEKASQVIRRYVFNEGILVDGLKSI